MAALLPYAHVDKSLRSLAGKAEGFGRFAVGGHHGAVYRVTTLAGTLSSSSSSLFSGSGTLPLLRSGS